jgi:hypothetical protein
MISVVKFKGIRIIEELESIGIGRKLDKETKEGA